MLKFPEVDEGSLSKWRASLVNEATLQRMRRDLNLADHILLGNSESREALRGASFSARPLKRLLAPSI